MSDLVLVSSTCVPGILVGQVNLHARREHLPCLAEHHVASVLGSTPLEVMT